MKTKINWLSIVQGWAMLWVVIGHSYLGNFEDGPSWENALMHFAYSFHMPLLMVISGYLFYVTRLNCRRDDGEYRWTYKSVIIDKTIRLLVPYLFFTIIAFIIKLAIPEEVSRSAVLSVGQIARAFIFPNDNPLRELWFIFTLFLMFLLTPVWRYSLNKRVLRFVVLFALIILHYWHPETEFLCIGRVCAYSVYFYIGLLCSQLSLPDKVFKPWKWLLLVGGAGLFVAGRLIDTNMITALGGIAGSLALAMIFDQFIPRLFFSFRTYTYQIYLMGIFAQLFVKLMYRHFSLPYIPVFIVCIVFGLYIPVLVSKCLERINWPPLLYCVGLKSKTSH